jgi:hypothetical protein
MNDSLRTCLTEISLNVSIDECAGALKHLKVLLVNGNRLQTLPLQVLKDCSSLHRLRVEGNNISKASLMKLDGFDVFDKRRQEHVNKELSAGMSDTDRTVCGLD